MNNETISTKKGGTKPLVHLLPMMALLVFGMIALVGVVSADDYFHGAPPVTKLSGEVNGSVDVLMNNPDTWSTTAPTRDAQHVWGNMTLNAVPSQVDLEFARLYVVVYCGNMSADYTGSMSVQLYNGNTPGDVLVNDKDLSLSYDRNVGATYDTSVVYPLVNLSRVTSDYVAVFDVKDNLSDLNTNNLNVSVTTYNETGNFDGRVKTVQLVYGWNVTSGSTGNTKYWVNEGHDPMTKNGTANVYNTTWFNDTGNPRNYDATLWVDYLASTDGAYKWNSNSFTPVNINQWTYAGLNRYAWSNVLGPGMSDDNYLEYYRGNNWYKMNFAVLALK